MGDEKQKQRLAALLIQMQGDRSQRGFARHLKISYASVSAYMLGDSFPETKNLEKIAKAKGWTRDELEAYLEDRPIERKRSIDDILQEVRAMTVQDALIVAKVALDRIGASL